MKTPVPDQDSGHDPLEVAAEYGALRMSDWMLLETRNGLSVFLNRNCKAIYFDSPLLILCNDHASGERECVVVSVAGKELLRVAGQRVRARHEDFGFTAVLTGKIDRFIDSALTAVQKAEEGTH